MDVIEAILARHSVRNFSSKPVPQETIMKILEVATRSPSGGNGQPWEVFVASGATIEGIRRVCSRAEPEALLPVDHPHNLHLFRSAWLPSEMNDSSYWDWILTNRIYQHNKEQGAVYSSFLGFGSRTYCFGDYYFLYYRSTMVNL